MKQKLGATGDYPRGKLSEEDEGGLNLAVYLQDKTVILAFGKPVAWLGLSVGDARAIAAALIEKANMLESAADAD